MVRRHYLPVWLCWRGAVCAAVLLGLAVLPAVGQKCAEINHESDVRTYSCTDLPPAIEMQGTSTNVTVKTPCDESLWQHIYHPKRLVVQKPCLSVTGVLVDASHGRNKDGCRHEADGDCHTWLKLDKGQESLLNAKNLSNEAGNLVIEPICRYRVTQTDAVAACKGWTQQLALPPPGTRVRVTGAYVLDAQHGHMEIHPVSSIEVLP